MIKINSKENRELAIKETAKTITNGGVVILPFDTVYGICCDPNNESAIEKIFKFKNRRYAKTLGLAFSDIETLKKYTVLKIRNEEFIRKMTPGRYTFILPTLDKTISPFCRKNNSYGTRIPDNSLILDIIKKSGGVIAQTSANLSGQPNCFLIEDIERQYDKSSLQKIDIIVDGGEIENRGPSQIYSLLGSKPELIERK